MQSFTELTGTTFSRAVHVLSDTNKVLITSNQPEASSEEANIVSSTKIPPQPSLPPLLPDRAFNYDAKNVPENECPDCHRQFKGYRGVANHRRSCPENHCNRTVCADLKAVETSLHHIIVPLPEIISSARNTVTSSSLLPSDLCYVDALSKAYDQIIHWKKNCLSCRKGRLEKILSMK